MIVDSNKDMGLKMALRNDGSEPAYGMSLGITSTVLLMNLPTACAKKEMKNEVCHKSLKINFVMFISFLIKSYCALPFVENNDFVTFL